MAHTTDVVNNRGQVLQGRARDTIYNVYKYFENDKHRTCELLRELNLASRNETNDSIPIPNDVFAAITEYFKESLKVTQRVANATGVNRNTVSRIKQEGLQAAVHGHRLRTPARKKRKKSFIFDSCDLYALSNVLTKLYMEDNKVPTMDKILSRAQTDLNYKGSMTTLRRILVQQLGYKIHRGTDKTKQLIFIRPDISGKVGGNSSDEELASENESDCVLLCET